MIQSWFQSDEALQFFQELSCVKAFKVSTKNCYVQGYLQREPGTLKGFFSRRAIVIGGPVIKPGTPMAEVEKLLTLLKNATRDAIYVEIRCEEDFSEYSEAFEASGFEYKPHLNVKIKCDSNKEALARMDDNRRRQIKRATESGAECKYADEIDEVDEFYELLKQHYKNKVRKPLFPLEFFEKIISTDAGRLLICAQDGRIIGGMLQVMTADTVYDYYACGLDAEYAVASPSVLLYWKTITNAISDGQTTFDTMGAGVPGVPYGVRDFKLRFGGELVEHGRYLHINHKILYNIGKLGLRLLC